MPIDLRVIACRIEVAPYCGVINAALQPLREVLKIAAFLAQVLGEIFRAIVFALVALLEIFVLFVNISEIAFFICGNAGAVSNLYKTLIVV